MNQYPAGLVPMMVPQQYMVMPGAAMQLPPGMSGHHPHGALQPAAMLHHQHMAAQAAAAASHAAGAPVMTSPVVTSGTLSALSMGQQGMVSIAGLPPHMTGVGGHVVSAMGGAVPGLHQAYQGIPASYAALTPLSATSALSSQLLAQQQQFQQQPQHLQFQLQQLQHLHQASVSPHHIATILDLKKKDEEQEYGRQGGNQWQVEGNVDLEEPQLDEYSVVLDHFNSDLNLVIDQDGYGGTVLNDPSGFCFTWAGARATYGVCRGKVFYEVHVVEHLPTDFGDDHQETDPHILRVGWSIDSSSFQLGEEPWSFGYGGTGKFSTNNRFSDYAVRFEQGDVIGALLDLDSRPASISFMKNGTWYGVAAPLHGFPVGSKEMALFPHILSKNCRFKVNFGQQDSWFPPPMGFRYIGQLQLMERVRGMAPPARKSDCEMIMIVGLPGAGKTTWAINMQKTHPEKRYNIIGTDTLIDKMRVMGLPRKRNYHGRWDVLIDKATKCLNKLFILAAKRRRNYILDQTNVYGSARKRKMKNFTGFYRIAAVIQPDDPELERRSKKRTQEDGKMVPESAVLEMKANFSLPEDRDNLFDRIDFIELQRDGVNQLMRIYNQEGKSKSRQDISQNRFDGNKNQEDHRQLQYGSYGSQSYGRSDSYEKDTLGKHEYWYPDQDQPPSKRSKADPTSALELLKQQYEEDDRQSVIQQVALVAPSVWSDPSKIKEETATSLSAAQWPPAGLPPGYHQGLIPSHIHAQAFQPGLLGAPPGLHHGVQLAFLPPGMPPPAPSELASMSLAAKALNESSVHPAAQAHAAQLAHAQAAAVAVHGQLLLDPSRLQAGSPYALVSQANSQSLYGAAPPGYEALVGQDSSRQAWQHAAEHAQAAHLQAFMAAQQQQAAAHQQQAAAHQQQIIAQHVAAQQAAAQQQQAAAQQQQAAAQQQQAAAQQQHPTIQHPAAQQAAAQQAAAQQAQQQQAAAQQIAVHQQQVQQASSWQQKQDATVQKSQSKPWRQDTSSSASWQSKQTNERDAGKRGNGNRDSSFNRPDSRNRDRERDSDRDRIRDRDFGYSRNKNNDKGYGKSEQEYGRSDQGYGKSDQGYGRSDQNYGRSDQGYDRNDQDDRAGGYGRDPESSWNSQDYGSGASSEQQDFGSDSGKSDRQRKRKSKWDQPGEEDGPISDQIKQEPEDIKFSGNQSQPVQSLFNQPPPGFPGPPASSSQPNRSPTVSLPSSAQGSKPSSFEGNFSRPPPPLLGNIKSEISPSVENASTPNVKQPVNKDGDGLLGQGPGPRPLISASQGPVSGQFKPKESLSDSSTFRQPPSGGNDSVNTRNSDSSISNTRKSFSPDHKTKDVNSNEDSSKQPAPKPLIKVEDKIPEISKNPVDKAGPNNQSQGGPGKPGSFPAHETDSGPGKGQPFKPRGPFGANRFPGPPPPLFGPGMLGPGPPPSNMGPRPPRGGPMGPRGPPRGGSMGGPPSRPMGGPHHGRGPGPWNQNRPRFAPRGPQGPPRPLFDGPPGRWPRQPR